jgi:hypothetical protein
MAEPIQAAWSVPRTPEFELKDFALGVLEIAKENLQRDGELVPTAFLITSDQIQCMPVNFAGHEEKLAVYGELVKAARAANAVALITVNDAFMSNKAGRDAVESYYPGKLEAGKSPECIVLTVSGPGIKNWSVDVPYKRNETRIEFGEATEQTGGDIGFLEGWAAEPEPKVQ